MKKCVNCEKDLQSEYKMVALEKPYMNIYFCEECYEKTLNELEEYLSKNLPELLKYYQNLSKKQ